MIDASVQESRAATTLRKASKVAEELEAQFGSRFSAPLIRGHVMRAMIELRGSTSMDGLSEMVSRLATHRLTAIAEAQDNRSGLVGVS